MEATAKFDFMASGEDELSFRTGDILKVGNVGSQGSREGLRFPGPGHQGHLTTYASVAKKEYRLLSLSLKPDVGRYPNPSTQEVETGRSTVPRPALEFEVSLCYMRPYLKTKQRRGEERVI